MKGNRSEITRLSTNGQSTGICYASVPYYPNNISENDSHDSGFLNTAYASDCRANDLILNVTVTDSQSNPAFYSNPDCSSVATTNAVSNSNRTSFSNLKSYSCSVSGSCSEQDPGTCSEFSGEVLCLELFCHEYMDHKSLRLKTRSFYEKVISCHIAPHYDKFPDLKTLTPVRVAEIILKPIIAEDKISTAYNTRNTIVAVINHARIVHDLSMYPQFGSFNTLSQIARIPQRCDYEKSFAAMINGDIGENIARIFELFHQHVKNIKILVLLELTFHLCLRQNEVLNIRKSNIDYRDHCLHIDETKTISAKKGGFDVPLTTQTEALLKYIISTEIKEENPEAETDANTESESKAVTDTKTEKTVNLPVNEPEEKETQDDYIFTSGKLGKRMATNALGVYFNRIEGLKGNQTAHGIRAIFKTWAHRNKIDDTISECVLSHRCWSKVAISYNRDLATYLYTDRKELMKKWSDFLSDSIGSNSVLKRSTDETGSRKGRKQKGKA